MHDNLLVLYSW